MKSCGPITEILEPMLLAFVRDRRVTSTNVLLHPYPRDVRSSSFTSSYAATQLVLLSLTSWITSVVASARCDTPVVIHHVIWPRYPTIDLFS